MAKTFFKLCVYQSYCVRILAGAAAALVKQAFKNMNTWLFVFFTLYLENTNFQPKILAKK